MLFSIFSKPFGASNPQMYAHILREGLYILTGYDVINYFPSAGNRVHITAAVTDVIFMKWSFWQIAETTTANNFKIYLNASLEGLTFRSKMMSLAAGGESEISKRFTVLERVIQVRVLRAVRRVHLIPVLGSKIKKYLNGLQSESDVVQSLFSKL